MEKLSTEYEFDVTRHSTGGVTTVLRQVSFGQTKVFYQAVGRMDSLYDHMCSLTDSQCEQWFNAKERKKKPHRTEPTVTGSGLVIPAINQIIPETVQASSVQSPSTETKA